jgi:hypothetical protein
MPANLTPQSKAAGAAFRKARNPRDRLGCLREMPRILPKHKGTDRLQGDIRRRVKERSEGLERHGGLPARRSAPRGARGADPPWQQPGGQTWGAGPREQRARRGASAVRSRTSSRIIATNAGWVSGPPARAPARAS